MIDNESRFMYILDMCQDLSINELQALISNIEIIIENKKEEEREKKQMLKLYYKQNNIEYYDTELEKYINRKEEE